MSARSDPELLTLHSVRIQGGPTLSEIADRFDLDYRFVHEHLTTFGERGWVTPFTFAGKTTWSLTSDGKAENERQLAAELDVAGARTGIMTAHSTFIPLNARHGKICTRWQIKPTLGDPMAMNDHTDIRWDNTVVRDLADIARDLDALGTTLTASLGLPRGSDAVG